MKCRIFVVEDIAILSKYLKDARLVFCLAAGCNIHIYLHTNCGIFTENVTEMRVPSTEFVFGEYRLSANAVSIRIDERTASPDS
jgi:hypothetical protein